MELLARHPEVAALCHRQSLWLATLFALAAASCGGLVTTDDDAGGPPVWTEPCPGLEPESTCGAQKVLGAGIPCRVELVSPPPDVDEVLVAVECQLVTWTAADEDGSSWAFAPDNSAIEIRGEACQQLASGAARRVDIAYGCARMY